MVSRDTALASVCSRVTRVSTNNCMALRAQPSALGPHTSAISRASSYPLRVRDRRPHAFPLSVTSSPSSTNRCRSDSIARQLMPARSAIISPLYPSRVRSSTWARLRFRAPCFSLFKTSLSSFSSSPVSVTYISSVTYPPLKKYWILCLST
jgi:hypothetical protein